MSAGRPRVLLAIPDAYSAQRRQADRRAAAAHAATRSYLIEEVLGTVRVNQLSLAEASRGWQALYRLLPAPLSVALEAFRRRRRFDVVVTWHPRVTAFYLLLQTVFRDRHPHVALLYWLSKPVTRWSLRLTGRRLTRLVTWVPRQASYAVERLGIAPERVVVTGHPVDQLFWSREHATAARDPRLVVSAGREMRDYATLVAAMAGTDLHATIAAPPVRVTRGVITTERSASADAGDAAEAVDNVEWLVTDPVGLRDLYASAAVVAVPLLPSDTDNGITVIHEAMVMGCAVVATANPALADVIVDGEEALLVPPGDPQAMRAAIEALVADPERARRLGEAARRAVLARHTLDDFAAALAAACADACAGTASGAH